MLRCNFSKQHQGFKIYTLNALPKNCLNVIPLADVPTLFLLLEF